MNIIRKMITTLFILFLLPVMTFLKVSLENYYPKILSLNNDGINEVLFLKYRNDEGENVYLKIFDINYFLVYEEKISPTDNEISIGDVYIYPVKNLKKNLSTGVYIFVLVSSDKIVYQGSFIVVK